MEAIEQESNLEKFEKIYRENPDSKVFAPLAEIYRKNGKQNKAMVILKEGIKKYPGYILGYLGLSNCYFDIGEYELAYDVIKGHVKNNRENIKLQKLFAKICEKTNRSFEALDTYKYINFLDPKDKLACQRLVQDNVPAEVREKEPKQNQEDWVAVDFSGPEGAPKLEIIDKLVQVNVRKKDYKKAFEYLDVSLDLDPNDQWAIDMKKDLKEKQRINPNPHHAKQNKTSEKEAKLLKFLRNIQARATEYRSSI